MSGGPGSQVGQFGWLGQGGSFGLNFRCHFLVRLIEFAKGLDTGSERESQERLHCFYAGN